MKNYLKRPLAAFALASLGGCATMQYTGTNDCVERNGFAMNIPLLVSVDKRRDHYSEECATARAATVISQMKKTDGTPDLGMYNLSVSLYEQSNPKVRDFMDKMLAEQGTSVKEMKFEIMKADQHVTCARVVSADGAATGFRCTTPAAAAAAAPAAPAAPGS